MRKENHIFCLAACNENQECLTSVHMESVANDNCFLYKNHFNSTETTTSSNTKLFIKISKWRYKINKNFKRNFIFKIATSSFAPISSIFIKFISLIIIKIMLFFFALDNSLLDVFQNFSLKTTISSYPAKSFSTLYGFGIIDDANATYYALDNFNSTNSNFVLYNRNWTYLTYITMPIYNPISIQSINNELYITAQDGIFKTDKSLNLVKSYNRTGAYYSSIYHNSTCDILYVTNFGFNRIDLFYRNLSFISSINLTSQSFAITEKKGKIYVGINDGVISVIENNLVVKNIATLCTGWITSIVFDTNDLMAVLCFSYNILYLYTINSTYTGKYIATPTYPRFMSYDLNGRFIIAGQYQINLYC